MLLNFPNIFWKCAAHVGGQTQWSLTLSISIWCGSISEGKGDSRSLCMLGTCWGNKPLCPTPSSLFFFFLPEKPNYFIKELSDLKIEESGTAVFICQSEKAASSVIWRKGIAELRPGRKYEMTQKGRDLQLTIKNLEKSDSDTYTCDIGDAQSRAKLVVQGMRESHVTVHPVSPLPILHSW